MRLAQPRILAAALVGAVAIVAMAVLVVLGQGAAAATMAGLAAAIVVPIITGQQHSTQLSQVEAKVDTVASTLIGQIVPGAPIAPTAPGA